MQTRRAARTRATIAGALAVVLTVATACSGSGGASGATTAETVSATVDTSRSASSSESPTTIATTGTTGATATDAGHSDHFPMLPVGATLPSDAECAERVRPTPEVRPDNTVFNRTPGSGPPANPPPGGLYERVTGRFTGTTDEIIQWGACKWGIDEDIVRAQAVIESYWHQDAGGDFDSDTSTCVPGRPVGQDVEHPGQCPQSTGLLQVRYPYWQWAFPDSTNSTAYNVDVALAARRTCFEGMDTWLNSTDRGRDYAAGDIWGCVGLWYAGRWYTGDAVEYTGRVQQTLSDKYWEDPSFLGDR